MSTKNNEKLAEKAGNLLSNNKSSQHLARIESQNPTTYSVNLTFLEPSERAGIFLERVPVMRTGAGRLPREGETAIVGYIGCDTPFVQGVLEEGGYPGIVTGKEVVLGDDGKVVIDNSLLVLEGQSKTTKDLFTDIYTILDLLSKQLTPSPGSPLGPSIVLQLPLLKAAISQVFKK